MSITPVKRALLSVSDKTQIVDFANALTQLGIEIISTGGTANALKAANVPHKEVHALTGFTDMLDGRVKTLHPKLHAGILGKRDQHAQAAVQHAFDWIDLVVVNFYPFNEKVKDITLPWSEVVEYIDIGGPTMVRAAAKNFAWVGVIVNPQDYSHVITMLKTEGGLSEKLRLQLANQAFAAVYHYDAAIHYYFNKRLNDTNAIHLHLEESNKLRYGENPHQQASAYQFKDKKGGVLAAKQHQGKSLSYNNLLDADAAFSCVQEFQQPACVIVKHGIPCGVAVAKTIEVAYDKAFQADSLSAFGGIVALNQLCTQQTAAAITNIFIEVVIAPAYSAEALTIFATKPNLRILQLPVSENCEWEMRFIQGGVLMQEKDHQILQIEDLQIVTQTQPSQEQLKTMQFAWTVVKHIKSNAILIAKGNATVGVGAGQVSRIDAVEMAIRKAGSNITNSILASDAFFPFRDSIDRIAQAGIKAIIQPGGSIKDKEVIAACDEHLIAMAFTGKRCFKH